MSAGGAPRRPGRRARRARRRDRDRRHSARQPGAGRIGQGRRTPARRRSLLGRVATSCSRTCPAPRRRCSRAPSPRASRTPRRCRIPAHPGPQADRRDGTLGLGPAVAPIRVQDRGRFSRTSSWLTRSTGHCRRPSRRSWRRWRTTGDRLRSDAAAAGAVLRDRDGEPDRAGRHLPTSRGAARPIPRTHLTRIPRPRRGIRIRRGPGSWPSTRQPAARRLAGRAGAAARRGRARVCRSASPRLDRGDRGATRELEELEVGRFCPWQPRARSHGARRRSRRGSRIRDPGRRRATVRARTRPSLRPERRDARKQRHEAGAPSADPSPVSRASAAAGATLGHARVTIAHGSTVPLVPVRRFAGLAAGTRRSLRRGDGDEVVGSRPYPPGDPVSSIDWAASARLSTARNTDVFVVHEHFAAERPRVAIAIDQRSAMSLDECPFPWLDKADAVRVVTDLIVRSARAARIDVLEEPHTREDLGTSLRALVLQRARLPTGSFVFVVSDFLGELDPRHRGPMRARAWDVTPVVVQDPTWEQSFRPWEGSRFRSSPPTGRHQRGVAHASGGDALPGGERGSVPVAARPLSAARARPRDDRQLGSGRSCSAPSSTGRRGGIGCAGAPRDSFGRRRRHWPRA